MSSYQLSSSAFETVHCPQVEAPKDCDKTEWLGKAVVDETNNTFAYNPVVERHIRDLPAYIRENMRCITSMAGNKFF